MIIIHTSSCLPPLARLSTTHCARESVFKANQPSWRQGEMKIFIRHLRNGWMELMYERDLNGRLRVNRLWFKNQPRFCQVIVEGEKNARVRRIVSALANRTSRFLELFALILRSPHFRLRVCPGVVPCLGCSIIARRPGMA